MSNIVLSQATKSGPKPKYKSLAEHIQALCSPEPMTGCWLWTGSIDRKGYGQLTHLQKHLTAHRASYQAFRGELKVGDLVCHDCDQPSCVNPNHLYAGTHVDNRRDMLIRKRWSHAFAQRDSCKNGHKYSEVGFSIAPDKTRVCKACQRINKQNQRKQHEQPSN